MDIWARLAKLDGCCDVRITNNGTLSHGGEGRWICRVSTRGAEAEAFEVSAPTMAEAVQLAVTEAERRHWPASFGG